METKDLVLILTGIIAAVGTVVSAAIAAANYFADHPISIPFPQENATTQRYITFTIPRVFPPLPSPVALALLVMLVAFLVVGAAVGIYGIIRPVELPLEPTVVVARNELGIITDQEKRQYRNKVKQELPKIRTVLDKRQRVDIQFEAWNVGIDHNRKGFLIDNPKHYKALEAFSDSLNDRNKHLFDKQFRKKNQVCINRYGDLRKLGFVE